MSDFFTVNQLAEYFNVNPKTIYRRLWAKQIPACKLGGRGFWKIPKWFPKKFQRLEVFDLWVFNQRHPRVRYCLVYKPSHPRANRNGFVGEHIVVWEKNHGQSLPEGWLVHHVNKMKGNNRPENLEAMSLLEHRKLHNKEMWERRKNHEGNQRAIP